MHLRKILMCILLGLAIIMMGCKVEYKHELFERQTDPAIVDGFTVKPKLPATRHGKVGNFSGEPWRLRLVVEGASDGAVMRIHKAVIRDGSLELDLTPPSGKAYLFKKFSDSFPAESNITLEDKISIEFEESKTLRLELVLEVDDGSVKKTIEKTFIFKGRLMRGTETFNPITDPT